MYAGHREKTNKKRKKEQLDLFLGIHPPHERPCGTRTKKDLFLWFYVPRHLEEKNTTNQKNKKKWVDYFFTYFIYAAVPNHRSWSPRSDVAGFMDVMQTKGSRQISRVPSEDAVAPTSGEEK